MFRDAVIDLRPARYVSWSAVLADHVAQIHVVTLQLQRAFFIFGDQVEPVGQTQKTFETEARHLHHVLDFRVVAVRLPSQRNRDLVERTPRDAGGSTQLPCDRFEAIL